MKQLIHYALILDQSGSMQELRKEVISSFNEQIDMIQRLRKENTESEIKLTLCVFNDQVDFRYFEEDIDHAVKLNIEFYNPDGCTALYDAIGITILRIGEVIKEGEKAYLAKFTDGLENASMKYTASDISYKLGQAEKLGWNIKFFCRYEDESNYRAKLNLRSDQLLRTTVDEDGMKCMYNRIMCDLSRITNDSEDAEV